MRNMNPFISIKRGVCCFICLSVFALAHQSAHATSTINANQHLVDCTKEMTMAMNKIEVVNAGIGGNTSAQLLERVERDVIAHSPDIVVLMIGTNDMVNSNKLTPYERYKSQLELLVDQIQKSGAKVLLMSPPPVDSSYLFERHDRNLFPFAPNEKLEIVRAVVSQLASDKGLPFVDVYQAYRAAGFPESNAENLMMDEGNSGRRDGVHPTALGYQLIGNLVYKEFLNQQWLSGGKRIICFGDSITRGVHVKGTGTSSGETYPAVLNSLIQSNLTP